MILYIYIYIYIYKSLYKYINIYENMRYGHLYYKLYNTIIYNSMIHPQYVYILSFYYLISDWLMIGQITRLLSAKLPD